jgi:hypothetical protein
MLRQMLNPTRYELEVISAEVLTGEVVSLVEQHRVELLCIAALPPEAMAPTRHLCKRLRVKFPELKIVVGRWGFRGDLGEKQALLLTAGADEVGMTLRQTRNQVMQLSQLFPALEPQTSPNSAHG